MFDIVLNIPQSSPHFALSWRICYFPIFTFGTCGANVSMVMFVEGFFLYSDIYTTFKRKKIYNHQVILNDIPGKTKNRLKI